MPQKTLSFSIDINAPREHVWKCMLDAETFKQWTAAYTPGSHYEGSWEQGATIRFLNPEKDGMLAEIAENRYLEHISIRHYGYVMKGVDDTTSDAVKAMQDSYEKYTFAEVAGGTKLEITMDTSEDYESFLNETTPKAMALLKELCEAAES